MSSIGCGDAQLFLGQSYEKGFGVKKEEPTALNYYQMSAFQGNCVAQYYLSLFYLKETKKFNDAVKWMYRAATYGNYPPAQYRMATLFSLTSDYTRSVTEAARYLHMAADQGMT